MHRRIQCSEWQSLNKPDRILFIMPCATIEVTSVGAVAHSNRAEQLLMQHPGIVRSRTDHSGGREREDDQIDRMNTADVVQCPDLVYIRRRVGQTADVPAGHHQPWLTTPCVEQHNRDYRVSRPETRSADHLEPEPNSTSRAVYDFRIQKGHRTSLHRAWPDTR